MPDVPKNAKKPEDHKPKADKPKMIEVTVNGLDLTIDPDALDDFELLDDLNALDQDEDATRLPSLLRRLLGDQYRPAIDSLRGENGRVSVEAGMNFLQEVMEAINPNS